MIVVSSGDSREVEWLRLIHQLTLRKLEVHDGEREKEKPAARDHPNAARRIGHEEGA
jgi:hypothetical protein